MMISHPRSTAVAVPELELALVVQPVMRVGSGFPLPVAYECLLRVAQAGELAPPARVIAAAEEDGSIVGLDMWVVSQAARIASAFPHASLWVNSSQISICDSRFIEHAISEFDRHGVTSRMTFEITESANGDAFNIIQGLERLNLRAMPVMLDDLRDGFAKRQLLMNKAVTGCKLSRRTTQELATSSSVRADVESLVRSCRAAGKRVVLEGIEHAGELELALSLDIELCQGFFFGRPARPEIFLHERG
jgi:EAL domain-containing protein (putative c-di-GMP-specific phosphodiesterase class I)